MNLRTVKFDGLTSAEIAAWSAVQCAEPMWASPFFRPEFTEAVSAVRKNVEVAILEERGRPVGFFPFERRPWNRGVPVGTRLSDYQGVIAPRNVEVDPIELVRGCGLSSWSFDHLLSPQSAFAKFTFRYADSPCVDLSNGHEAYESTLTAHLRSQMRRKHRKLEREVGPLRFEPHVRDSAILETLVSWKIDQYERTKTLNILGFSWVRELLERLLHYQGQGLSVMMPALYAGDRVMAIGFLLRSGPVSHAWFSSYDRDFAMYSPGIQQKMAYIRAAPPLGITWIDMGKGAQHYKQILATSAIRVAEGVVDPVRLKAGVRSAWWAVRSGIQASPLHNLIKRPVQKAFHFQGWLHLR